MRLFRTYLTAPRKSEYVKRKKDPSQCFLCAITQKTTGVEAWEVFRDDQIMVLLNRFPYNPGHLLIAPLEHHDQFEALPTRLASHLTIMLQRGSELPPAKADGFLRVRRTPQQQDEGELSFYH